MSDDDGVLELANRFFSAIEAGDADTIYDVLDPDVVVWSNFAGDNDLDHTLRVLRWLHRQASGLRYDVRRREVVAGGFLQEHVLRATAPDGSAVAMPACIIATVADGRIVRLHEYLDPSHAEALGR